ncbi:hypothetical protein SAMN05216275_1135 [Streptosporangium canum]|uniref:Uncharacterized protein n=2 Tax=Streptosporangium canum TaxID=324952 RepID=A0A1I3UQ53_9ACTN|nr:hypothetical protein SAMN05216275_1135 [Streptosporangium canum]
MQGRGRWQVPGQDQPHPLAQLLDHLAVHADLGFIRQPNIDHSKLVNASAVQLGAAMAALGLYDGTNAADEHAAEAARLGGDGPYRMRLANAPRSRCTNARWTAPPACSAIW